MIGVDHLMRSVLIADALRKLNILILAIPTAAGNSLPFLRCFNGKAKTQAVCFPICGLKHSLWTKALVAVLVADLIALLLGVHALGDGLVFLVDRATLANSRDRLNNFRADVGFHFHCHSSVCTCVMGKGTSVSSSRPSKMVG